MSPRAFQRWVLAGGFAVAAGYAVVALVVVIANRQPAVAIPFAITAVTIAGPLAVVSRLLEPPPKDGPGSDDPGRDDGPGPPGGGDDEPTAPSWWPEFEAAFWAQLDSERPRTPARERGGSPTPV
jgi:hypothetical protein